MPERVLDKKGTAWYNESNYQRSCERREPMEPREYTVVGIEGEYAHLRADGETETLFIAMALLPEGIDVGTRLHYEMLCYTVIA